MNNVIHESFRHGRNFKIGNFCVIDEGVTIGDDVTIGSYTKIGCNVVIGDGCFFNSYCEIRNECKLGDGVTMGSRCTLSAGTIVEDNVITKYSFVYTDTPVLSQNDKKIVGTLKKGSRFGANVTIMPGVTIGMNAEIGACSLVRTDVPDNEVWFGTPAKFYKKVI